MATYIDIVFSFHLVVFVIVFHAIIDPLPIMTLQLKRSTQMNTMIESLLIKLNFVDTHLSLVSGSLEHFRIQLHGEFDSPYSAGLCFHTCIHA